MRHFVVLGFSSHSKDDAGESLYLGGDRGEAIAVTNEPSEKHARKELYELATPHMRRQFEKEATETSKPAAKKTSQSKK